VNNQRLLPDYLPRIFVRGGKGKLTGAPGCSLKADVEVKVFAFAPELLARMVDEGKQVLKNSLLPSNTFLDETNDFVVLKASEKRWLARLRLPGNRHRAVPKVKTVLEDTLEARLVCVNAPNGGHAICSTVNTPDTLLRAADALCPDEVSSASGLCQVLKDPQSGARWRLRYRVGTTNGSSGGGLYDEEMRLVGLHLMSEQDENGKKSTSENISAGIPLSAPEFRNLITMFILPYFENRTGKEAKECANDWRRYKVG
jgi:hypothetical protein